VLKEVKEKVEELKIAEEPRRTHGGGEERGGE
jgi:hypothetical protein